MHSVALKKLKNKLDEYVRLAAGGETVLITERDHVVAELVPHREEGAVSTNPMLADLVREGVVTPALVGPGPPPEPIPIGPLADLMRELDEERSRR